MGENKKIILFPKVLYGFGKGKNLLKEALALTPRKKS